MQYCTVQCNIAQHHAVPRAPIRLLTLARGSAPGPLHTILVKSVLYTLYIIQSVNTESEKQGGSSGRATQKILEIGKISTRCCLEVIFVVVMLILSLVHAFVAVCCKVNSRIFLGKFVL